MTPETAAGTVRELLRASVGRSEDGALVVSGHESVLREAVLAVADAEGGALEQVRLLGVEPAVSEAMDDFRTASRTAELVEDGTLAVRASDEAHLPSVVVTYGEVGGPSRHQDAGEVGGPSRQLDGCEVTTLTPLPGGDAVAVRTGAAEPMGVVRDALERAFENAAEYEVAAPGYGDVLASLESTVGPGVSADVATVLDAEVTVRSSDSVLDEIDAVLLMGGRNGAQLYELSTWAEDLGLVSRATMSSRKRRLEAAGLLTTEKVSTRVGRPRQRLLVADGLRDATPADLVRAGRSVLVGG